MNKYITEVVVDAVDSALNAQKAGANRIELCDNLIEGGTTPSYGMLAVLRELLDIDIHVMIRPRGGDFLYSHVEFEVMKRDIVAAKQLGANAVVFGILTKDGHIDKVRTQELLELAHPLSVTFHRAFDSAKDPFEALDDLIEIGVSRLLTSGQEATALQGANTIKALKAQANGKITIMPGSGINPENITELANITNCNEFHFSGKTTIKSHMEFSKTLNVGRKQDDDANDRQIASTKIIKSIIDKLNTVTF
ncbi:hypothetical protein PK35_16160 [Tamlana nanhaiensis]|uniref:PF03932 family protein CutC n=1 Tax=Neotamlana nanhaiensis TaxID=1382798 RepID=A0A0D7VWC0_9FLAO|nr:copper homeostasis protein CutC [Tamlana nanhaiensis]KJD31175.1 hypothetical protein PK35_16160 [Tamlana nanhaiensis]